VGRDGDQVYNGKVGGSPDTTAPAGEAVHWDVAFRAQSLDDLTIEGSLGWTTPAPCWSS